MVRISKTIKWLCASALLLQACDLVSRDGPSTGEIASPPAATAAQPSYVVVDLNKAISAQVRDYHDQHMPAADFLDLPPSHPVGEVGTGDVLHITIWEASPQQNGVFSQGHGADVTAVVDNNGDISVPYAGRFSIVGLSLPEIEATIVRKLKGKAYTPQVSVQLAENVSNTVFLQGEIGKPGRYPLTPGGNTLLDLIALAGGPRLQPHETTIQIRREGKTVSTDLFRIMGDPNLNITLSPGDSVIITRRLDMFYAFGAVNHVGQIPFSEHTTTLLQAMGAISGLRDDRADPHGIFIFRHEPRELIDTLPGVDAKAMQESLPQVVYRLNMDDPTSIFVLNAFPVQPSDIIYVSNAPMREFQKVVDSVFGSTATSVANLGISAAAVANGR